MGVSCIWQWVVPTGSTLENELSIIHNHIVHGLGGIEHCPSDINTVANSAKLGGPNLSLSTFENALRTSTWQRSCELYTHKLLDGVSTAQSQQMSLGSTSTKPRPSSLFGFVSLHQADQSTVYPSINLSSNRTSDIGFCLKITNSSYPAHSWVITPNCPLALFSGDKQSINLRVPVIDLAEFPLSEEDKLKVMIDEHQSALQHKKYFVELEVDKARIALERAQASAYMRLSAPDILETSPSLLKLTPMASQLSSNGTKHMIGSEYEIGEWIIRIGTTYSKGLLSTPNVIVVEIELTTIFSNIVPHSLFLDTFMQTIPQANHMIQRDAITQQEIWNVNPERELVAKQAYAQHHKIYQDVIPPIAYEIIENDKSNTINTNNNNVALQDSLKNIGVPIYSTFIFSGHFPGFDQYMLPKTYDPRHSALLFAYAFQITPT